MKEKSKDEKKSFRQRMREKAKEEREFKARKRGQITQSNNNKQSKKHEEQEKAELELLTDNKQDEKQKGYNLQNMLNSKRGLFLKNGKKTQTQT